MRAWDALNVKSQRSPLSPEEVVGFFGAATVLVVGLVLSGLLARREYLVGGVLLSAGVYLGAFLFKLNRFRNRVHGAPASEFAGLVGRPTEEVANHLSAIGKAFKTDPSRLSPDRTLGAYADDVAFLLPLDQFDDLCDAFRSACAKHQWTDEELRKMTVGEFLRAVVDQDTQGRN